MRRDVIVNAFRLYVAGRISRDELLGTVRQFRGDVTSVEQVLLAENNHHS